MTRVRTREIRETYRLQRKAHGVDESAEITAWLLQLDLPYVRITLGLERSISRVGRNQHRESVHTARQAALTAGIKTYTGSPCRLGHDGTRYAACGNCVQCARHRRWKEYWTEKAARLSAELETPT